MANGDPTSGGGMTAQHAPVAIGPYRVAPTEGGDKFNTIRVPIVPVACWRLNAPAFAFDSSFVSPDFAPELAKLAALVSANAGCPASLFAHADPVGSDSVNKHISDRRARAIHAVLTRQPEVWEDLYSSPVDGDTWGTRAIQTMLATLQDSSSTPYYRGAVDGEYGPGTTDAVKRFQRDAGLAPDGQAGPATRKVLFGAYMDAVCTDSSGNRFRMKSEDFLGGGADRGGKMAMQGCSRFNPIVLLPQSEEGASGDRRNADNAPNRRVLLFLFRPDRKVDPAEWPCPRVKEPADTCKAQFWPDGEQRRKNGDALRLYKQTHDTMACRFYDRFARRSPCEGGLSDSCRIGVVDEYETPLPGVLVTLDAGGSQQSRLTDAAGIATFTGVPPAGAFATIVPAPPLAAALARLVAKAPRDKAIPEGITVVTPLGAAAAFPVLAGRVVRVLIVARTDVDFDLPAGWESVDVAELGPWQLTKTSTHATLRLVSQGLGRTVTLQAPASGHPPFSGDFPQSPLWTPDRKRIVTPGETLASIAERYLGDASLVDVLIALNPEAAGSVSPTGPLTLPDEAIPDWLAIPQTVGSAPDAGDGPTVFATIDVDALHNALFTGDDETVWNILAALPREPRDDGMALSGQDLHRVYLDCMNAELQSVRSS